MVTVDNRGPDHDNDSVVGRTAGGLPRRSVEHRSLGCIFSSSGFTTVHLAELPSSAIAELAALRGCKSSTSCGKADRDHHDVGHGRAARATRNTVRDFAGPTHPTIKSPSAAGTVDRDLSADDGVRE